MKFIDRCKANSNKQQQFVNFFIIYAEKATTFRYQGTLYSHTLITISFLNHEEPIIPQPF